MLGILQAIFTLRELVKPELLEIQNLCNFLLACAYYSILFTLVYFISKRQYFPYKWIFLLFATLCFTSGTNHLIEVWDFWPFTSWLKTWMGAIAALVLVLTSINLSTITDITDRKLAENILEDYNRNLEIKVQERTAQLEREIADRQQIEIKLRYSQTKLSTILNNIGAYIYIKDLNSNYIYVNRLLLELFGILMVT